jgi:nitronate monooxygenase
LQAPLQSYDCFEFFTPENKRLSGILAHWSNHCGWLVSPNEGFPLVTDMITGRPARYIRNTLADDLIASGLAPVSFPAQLSLTAPLETSGDREFTILLAGQSAALGKDTNATALIELLAEDTSRHLRAFND